MRRPPEPHTLYPILPALSDAGNGKATDFAKAMKIVRRLRDVRAPVAGAAVVRQGDQDSGNRPMSDDAWDIVVVGAGAAGLMAAIGAAERGRRVLLLEKNRRPGVKVLMSGGTRCNITHAADERGIVAVYGPPGRFLHSALAAFGVQDTLDFFAAEGVATKVEETGKIFPVSDKALDVLNALLARLKRSGAALALEEPLRDLAVREPGFAVTTPQRILSARRVILTTGGQSY